MWQDDYITRCDGDFICWDNEGEYLASSATISEARQVITNYKDIIQRKQHGRTIQEFIESEQ